MPPRKKLVRRKKSSQANATTADDDHQLPTPEAELVDDVKVNETETVISIPEEVSNRNSNPAEIVAAAFSSESMIQEVNEPNAEIGEQDESINKVNEPNAEIGEQDESINKEKEDLLEIENVEGVISINGSQLETIAEINYVNKETTAVQVDDNNISLVAKNDDNNEKIEEITKVISVQETDINKSPCKNNISLTVEDNSMENVDDDHDIEGDDVENKDKDPPLVEDSQLDNKIDKEIEIYVGKLDKDTVEEDLINVFQQFGELKSTKIMRKLTTNKSKGFAFIQFASIDHANRVLSEHKDGIEVKGKLVKVRASHDKFTVLQLGNICRTWDKEKVLQQLKEYGIEHFETIDLPEDNKRSKKNRSFAFLEFKTHSDAIAALQRLQKPDAVFGRQRSAKVSYVRKHAHSSDENLSHVNRVHLEGVPKDWNEENVKEIGNKYGEISDIKLCQIKKPLNFGFITFASSESAHPCVEGINNTTFEGDTKIIASIAKNQQTDKGKANKRLNKKVNKKSEAKSSEMKGVMNNQQTKINNKVSTKNKNTVKPQQKGTVGEETEISKTKVDGDLQATRKRKVSSEQKLNTRDQCTSKKPNSSSEGQNSKKTGNNKRNNVSTDESRNAHGKKPLKKQKGNMHARENNNSRIPKYNTHIRREHDDYTRYIDPYAQSNTYHLAPDSLSARRLKEMEPHAGYLEPTSATQRQSYSGYVQPVVQSPYIQHHIEPAFTSQSQSQLYTRYIDPSGLTQSRGGYIQTADLPQVQAYRSYHQPEIVQIARDPYDSGLARVVRHDGRGAEVVAYARGPPLQNHTSYYQGGGSYSGGYGSQRTYY